MKLFTKDIDDKLFEQYSKGADLENQVAVAKIFNPYGRGTWYLLNSDPNDPDYLWAIVDLYEVESGSASRSELESIKVPPFNQHLERDLGFKPVNALELFNNLRENKQRNRMMAKGGNIKQIPVGEEYRYKGSSSIEKEIMEKINPQLKGLRFAGNFYIKDWKEDGYLYFLDDYDRKFVSDVNLKQNERIYRYFTRVTALGGMIPLVKINLENGLAYFNEKGHEGEIEFSSKGMKTDYLNLVKVEEEDYYAEGGGVYRLKDFDFNEEGNLQAIINDKKYEIIYRDDVSQMYDLFENGKVIKSSRIFRELTKFAEGGKVYSHDIDIISKSSNDPYFMFPKPTTGKSMGVELKDGGNIDFNIQVGDTVWVDNPYWKASTGNEKPVRRTVKMILGDSVFFSDGSNSSIQYLKKYKTEKTMAEGGEIGLSYNAEKYLGFMREMYPKTMDIDTTTPSKDINKAIAELELKGLIKKLSYNRGFAEYGIKNMKYENGGIIDFNDMDIPVIRTQFEEEDYEYEKGGEITNEERKESLKNYPKLKF